MPSHALLIFPTKGRAEPTQTTGHSDHQATGHKHSAGTAASNPLHAQILALAAMTYETSPHKCPYLQHFNRTRDSFPPVGCLSFEKTVSKLTTPTEVLPYNYSRTSMDYTSQRTLWSCACRWRPD